MELNLPESRIEQLLLYFLEMKEAMDVPYFTFSDNFAAISIGDAANHRAKSLPPPFESHEWSKYTKRNFSENDILTKTGSRFRLINVNKKNLLPHPRK